MYRNDFVKRLLLATALLFLVISGLLLTISAVDKINVNFVPPDQEDFGTAEITGYQDIKIKDYEVVQLTMLDLNNDGVYEEAKMIISLEYSLPQDKESFVWLKAQLEAEFVKQEETNSVLLNSNETREGAGKKVYGISGTVTLFYLYFNLMELADKNTRFNPEEIRFKAKNGVVLTPGKEMSLFKISGKTLLTVSPDQVPKFPLIYPITQKIRYNFYANRSIIRVLIEETLKDVIVRAMIYSFSNQELGRSNPLKIPEGQAGFLNLVFPPIPFSKRYGELSLVLEVFDEEQNDFIPGSPIPMVVDYSTGDYFPEQWIDFSDAIFVAELLDKDPVTNLNNTLHVIVDLGYIPLKTPFEVGVSINGRPITLDTTNKQTWEKKIPSKYFTRFSFITIDSIGIVFDNKYWPIKTIERTINPYYMNTANVEFVGRTTVSDIIPLEYYTVIEIDTTIRSSQTFTAVIDFELHYEYEILGVTSWILQIEKGVKQYRLKSEIPLLSSTSFNEGLLNTSGELRINFESLLTPKTLIAKAQFVITLPTELIKNLSTLSTGQILDFDAGSWLKYSVTTFSNETRSLKVVVRSENPSFIVASYLLDQKVVLQKAISKSSRASILLATQRPIDLFGNPIKEFPESTNQVALTFHSTQKRGMHSLTLSQSEQEELITLESFLKMDWSGFFIGPVLEGYRIPFSLSTDRNFTVGVVIQKSIENNIAVWKIITNMGLTLSYSSTNGVLLKARFPDGVVLTLDKLNLYVTTFQIPLVNPDVILYFIGLFGFTIAILYVNQELKRYTRVKRLRKKQLLVASK